MSDLQTQVEHGRQAKALAEDPAFLRAVDAVKRRYFDEMCATTADQTAKREQIYTAMTVIDDVINQLNIAINAGTVSASQLGKLARNAK